jgi:glycosyltransferase involved in cell wall biosynthesis
VGKITEKNKSFTEPMKPKVLYDVSVLGRGFLDARSRTGIFRSVESLLLEIINFNDVEISTTSLHEASSFWDEFSSELYVNNLWHSEKIEVPFIRRYDSEIPFYSYRTNLQKFLLRDAQTSRTLYRRGLRYLIAKLAKSFDYVTGVTARQKVPGQYDVFHAPFFALPKPDLFPPSTSRLITVHDLIPIKYPHLFTAGIRRQFSRILSSVDIDKDWIVCNSENTRSDLLDYFKDKLDSQRVFVSYFAAANHFHPIQDASTINDTKAQLGIPVDQPYLLSLGAIEPRKNLPFLIKCFSKIIQEQKDLDVNLVLVGPKGWRDKEIFKAALSLPALQDRIYFTGFVPDSNLSALYSGALAFVYPSLYEGFGLPPLEAMQCGAPVITSNSSSLPEVVGNAGIMVNPADEDALCDALVKVSQSGRLREELSINGLNRAQQFSWAKTAHKTIDIYQKISHKS